MQKTVATIAPCASSGQTLRVAAYCRVSSDSSDQRHSFAAQVQYYTKSISENERMGARGHLCGRRHYRNQNCEAG